MSERAGLPDLEESKEVEVTIKNPLTHTEALEPKPELLWAESGRNEPSVPVVPECCQELEEVKHEDLEKPLCHLVVLEDQFRSGLITTHFEIKEEVLERRVEGLRRGGGSRVVQLPRVELSPKPEVFIQDHPRLITLKDPKEGDLVVSEPTERRLGDQ